MDRRQPWAEDRARAIIAKHKDMRGALLPMLHAFQEEFGFIHRDAIQLLADALNITRAEVHGVASFYHDFRREAAGRHVIKVCRAESCQAMGADDLVEHAKSRLGVDMGGTTGDKTFTLEAVYCLGNCALSPAVMIDETLYGRVSNDRFDDIIAQPAEAVE
jgi:formate dehydrogenase subunit gamma